MRKLVLIFCIMGIGEIALAQWTSGSGTIYTTDKVGIGTINPETRFDVIGGDMQLTEGHALYSFSNGSYGSANATWSAFYSTGSTTRFLTAGKGTYSSSIPNMNFSTYDGTSVTHRMVIQSSTGNVGIGTTTPTEKLAVNGNIVAKEIKVTLSSPSWPDFVFRPSYKLPGLKETEEYININKRLPDIPSAEDVEKEGISLGEMNAKLLQKIEELTLHLIELNKENSGIKERLFLLEEKNLFLR